MQCNLKHIEEIAKLNIKISTTLEQKYWIINQQIGYYLVNSANFIPL